MRTAAPPLSVLLLLLVPSFAVASNLTQTVNDTRCALQSRVDALTCLEAPTKLEKKECRRLDRALGRLLRYAGTEDSKDLACCSRAAALVVRSGSEEAEVLSALESVKDSLVGLAEERRGIAFLLIASADPDEWPKIMKAIERADRTRELAWDEWPADPARAVKHFVKATHRFEGAIRKARKFQDHTIDPALEVYSRCSEIVNATDDPIAILEIRYEVFGLMGGLPYGYVGQATASDPEGFPIEIAGMDTYDLVPLLTTLAGSDPDRPRWMPGDFVHVAWLVQTTAGEFYSQ